jgi:uncharacterized protein YigE (DUF2233 family)
MFRSTFLIAAGVLAMAVPQAQARTADADKPPCAPFRFAKHSYTLCKAPLSQFDVRIFWKQPDGSPYTYLSSLPKKDKNGGKLAFALNGGMFDRNLRPVGLYIENGRQMVRANRASGHGNFHLKPNGVFYVGKGKAGVLETGAFLKRKPKALFATQSGPMLVIGGKLHRRIARATASEKMRDGVCVREGTVLFAISDSPVAFGAFARLFRNGLKCHDALFLDGGTAPALYVPAASRAGNSFIGLGPMIAVYEKRRP